MLLELSENEKLCKYLHEEGVDVASLFGSSIPEVVLRRAEFDRFFSDVLSRFLHESNRFAEDALIPEGRDIHILTQPRYMPVGSHTHDFIEMIYTAEGDYEQKIGADTILLSKGDLLLLAPGTFHCANVFRDEVAVFYIMVRISTFRTVFGSLLRENDMLSDFFAQTLYADARNCRYIKIETGDDLVLQSRVLEMYHEALGDDQYVSRMLSADFEWLCIYLLRHYMDDTKPKHGIRVGNWIYRYIAEHYRDLTLKDMARALNYSEGHLSRVVHRTTGKTFRELLYEEKLLHAKELLKNPAIPVVQVARDAGFCDTGNFYRIFKNRYSITPTQYRQIF